MDLFHKHECAMGSPVSPIIAKLYMEEAENKALSHWHRYEDDTWVKIRTQEVEAFTAHMSSVDRNTPGQRITVHCFWTVPCARRWTETSTLTFTSLPGHLHLKDKGLSRMSVFTLWAEKTDGLKEDWKKSSMSTVTFQSSNLMTADMLVTQLIDISKLWCTLL